VIQIVASALTHPLIQEFETNLASARATIQAMNAEVRRIEVQNETTIRELLQNCEIQNDSITVSRLPVIGAALEAAIHGIQKLRREQETVVAQIQKLSAVSAISEIPRVIARLMNEIEMKSQEVHEVKLHYSTICRRIGQVAMADSDEELPDAVARIDSERTSLKREVAAWKQNHSELIDSLHSVVHFRDDKDLVFAVRKLAASEKQNRERIDELTTAHGQVVQENERLTTFEREAVSALGCASGDEVCASLLELRQRAEDLESGHQQFVGKLCSELGVHHEKEVFDKLNEMFDALKIARKDLAERNQIFTRLQPILQFQSPDQLPSVIGEQIRNHQFLVSQLREVIPFREEREFLVSLIQLVQTEKELRNEVSALNDKYAKLTGDLKRTFSCKHDRQILAAAETSLEQQRHLQSELNVMHQNQQTIMEKIQTVVDSEPGDFSTGIDNVVNTLQTTCQALESERRANAKFVDRLKRIVPFEKPTELPDLLKGLVQIQSEHESLVSSHEAFVGSLESILAIEKGSDISIALQQLVDRQSAQIGELQSQLAGYHAIIERVSSIISFTSFEDVPQIISDLVGTNDETREKLRQLQESHNILQSEHQILQERQQHDREEHEQLLVHLSQTLSPDNASSHALSASQLVSQCASLHNKDSARNEMLSRLIEMTECSAESKLPAAVEHLGQAKEQYTSLVNSLRQIVTFDTDTELAQKVGQLHSESCELIEVKRFQEQTIAALAVVRQVRSFDELPAAVKLISDTLSEGQKLIGIDDPVHLPEAIRFTQSTIQELTSHLTTAADLLGRILSRVFKQSVSVTFPLETNLSLRIVKGFEDYADTTEALQVNVDALLSTARTIGYGGTSCMEAADCLADELCKKKAQEHLEETVLHMKQLREDKDRERQVFEQRNAANLQKLKEFRQSKAALIEQSASKQAELYDTIEDLQKESRDLEAQVEQLQRVKDELIRLCANDHCDQELLRTLLSSSERMKLKL
jgi:hypothetical protein